MGTDGLDEFGLDDEDLDFLSEHLETETTVYETVLNLRSPGLNLARKPVACMMCGRKVPFERIQSELVRASNTGLVICVKCGRCEGREGLHAFQVDVIQNGRRNGLPPVLHDNSPFRCGGSNRGEKHLWIMDRNQQRHGFCVTCANAHIEIAERTKGGLDLEGALKALAEKKKETRAKQRSEAMSIAEPYIKAGLAEPFALAIAAGTPAGEVMDLWESSWWKQYPADDSLIISVLHGELTEEEARVINEFRGEHRELAEACIEKLVPVAWAQMLLDAGFEDHPEAVQRVLEGAEPALIARIQNIPATDLPSPLGFKIEPEGIRQSSPPKADTKISSRMNPDHHDKIHTAKGIKIRADLAFGVLDAYKIDHDDFDAFLKHAAQYDVGKNGHLTKKELENAAEAWVKNTKPTPRPVVQMPFFVPSMTQGPCPSCGETIVHGSTVCGSCSQRLWR